MAKNNNFQDKIQKIKNNYEEFKKSSELRQEIANVINQWKEVMAETKTYNNMKLSLTLRHINQESYGWSSRIYSPYGIPLEKLDTLSSTIESGLKCKFIYSIPEHKQFAMCKIIYPNKVKINEMPFTPVKVKPYEFCPGYYLSGEPIIFNLNDTPQILIAGQQRRGKNGAADHGIINWIHSCDETEITFYMFQGAKNDLSKYKNCKQVYCYTEDIKGMIIALDHISEEMERRKKLFMPMIVKADGRDNIYHYNKSSKHKLPYIIVVIDEFISLMPNDKIDCKELKNSKNMIMQYLQNIAQWGGSFGINFLVLHQKPQVALMPSFIKNMSSIRICFGFEDLVCCSIVLGDELAKQAHKLPPRKAFFSNNETNDFLFTKNLKGKIGLYIENSINPNHRTLFGDLQKLERNNIVIDDKIDNQNIEIPKEEKGTALLPEKKRKNTKDNNTQKVLKYDVLQFFDNVDPNTIAKKDEQMKLNISNIPNFVPFIPQKNIKVIDKTNIIELPSQKPINKERDEK
jgi:S-DNA-T family DNA segregation ATPase FtsK/SpoIIIE